MTAKKKAKKKMRSTPSTRKKMTVKKQTPKKSVKKKKAQKKGSVKRRVTGRATAKTKKRSSKHARGKSQVLETTLPEQARISGGQSGDLQGLSNSEGADSESVDELLEEGNPFEAGIVTGVEEADDSEEEVRTHEVPEDDVPDEYLDNE